MRSEKNIVLFCLTLILLLLIPSQASAQFYEFIEGEVLESDYTIHSFTDDGERYILEVSPGNNDGWGDFATFRVFTDSIEESSQSSFHDVPLDHPFYDEIEALVASGITTGYDDGTFRPSATVNRMATAAFLVRGLALEEDYEVPAEPSFTDVSAEHPFYEEIELLVASAITTGYDDGTFRPSATVNRMATAAFLVRALALDKEYEVPAEPSFIDVSTGHPFYNEIELLAASGITGGYEDGTFRPSNSVTRMAMAAFLVRAFDLLAELKINSVDPITLTVDYGTENKEINLPEKVKAVLDDESEIDVNVDWAEESDPAYDPEEPGNYVFEGELIDLPGGVTNPDDLKAVATVTVLEEVVLKYTVTFEEANELEGVSIKTYDDADRTNEVGDLTTDSDGKAEIDLEDGEYWFTISIAGYMDYEGDFVVEGEDKVVVFEMVEMPPVDPGSEITADPETLTVGNESTVTVELKDVEGNAYTGLEEEDFVIDLGDTDAVVVDGSFAECGTEPATYFFDVYNETAEEVIVTVTVFGVELDDVTITFEADTAVKLAITAQPEEGLIPDRLDDIVVETQDQFGNPSSKGLPGSKSVQVTIEDGPVGAELSGTLDLNIGTVDGDGEVTFDDLKVDLPGTYTLKFTAAGLESAVSEEIEVPVILLSGFVRDKETGDPIEDASVRVWRGPTPRPDDVYTDEDGYYELVFTAGPGTYGLSAYKGGYVEIIEEVEIVEDRTYDFELAKICPDKSSASWVDNEDGTGTITITVKDTDDDPITGIARAQFIRYKGISRSLLSNLDGTIKFDSNSFLDKGNGEYVFDMTSDETITETWDIQIRYQVAGIGGEELIHEDLVVTITQ